ncbi:hypothetical protein ACFOD9_04555 [Novosphingobium bradum]|uniref:Uncharacterized protein n=1 Tax=Novosphingobium bradum TaxID=1737444 RepID=A0ABV7IQK0_9SPHN
MTAIIPRRAILKADLFSVMLICRPRQERANNAGNRHDPTP